VSLGTAWITTGSKFDEKLEENSAEVAALRDSLAAATSRILDQLAGATGRLDQLDGELASSQRQTQELKNQLAALQGRIKNANSDLERLRQQAEAFKKVVPSESQRMEWRPK
jgi:chromosome segregation ATPase